MEIFKKFVFDSAHSLPNVPPNHKCKRIHGHTYRLTLYFEGPLDPYFGWILDFNDIKHAVNPVIDQLDHQYLNEIPGLENPTCEIIAQWIWNKVKPIVPQLSRLELNETPTSGAVYSGK
jgi:6-pyruvoyltetrahydropterin/6-carboxytetrahydropterin synthase